MDTVTLTDGVKRLNVLDRVQQMAMRYFVDPNFAAVVDNSAAGAYRNVKSIVAKMQNGWNWVTSKRQRTESMTVPTPDPVDLGTRTKNTRVPGASGIFTGGVPQEPSQSLRLAKSVYADNISWLMYMLNRKSTLRACSEIQIIGDSEQRSCHMFTYRHRQTTSTIPASRTLLPKNTLGTWYPKVDGTLVTNTSTIMLDLNQGSTPEYYNGKCFYAPINIADLENQSFALMAPFIQQSYSMNSSTGNEPISMETFSAPLSYVRSPYYNYSAVQNGTTNVETPSFNRPNISPIIVDGGLKIDFSNKGPSGAFIEILVLKRKQNYNSAVPATNVANNADQPLNSYVTAIGSGYLTQHANNQGVVNLQGDQPQLNDVFSSPYHKLLPESRYVKPANTIFSQKERFKFALPSGAKKHCKISFGGFTGTGRPGEEGFSPETVSVIIAINGQIQSAELSKNGDNLVTGNICSPHNVMLNTEYYETVQAGKHNKPQTAAYIKGDLDPRFYSGTLPSNVTAHPYQMIAADKILREGQANGRRQHAQDGDTAMDEL